MSNSTHLGDRRAGLRFQVHGDLWASIDVRHAAVVRNVTSAGALLEARVSPDMRAVRVARVLLSSQGPELTVLVRHITPMTDAPADDACLLGVEFLNPTSDDRRAIEAFIARSTQGATPSSDN